jgi:hypothetical protein
LLWALGFGADNMRFVERLNCFGCSYHPWYVHQLDPTTMATPRQFWVTAIEVRQKGDEVVLRDGDKAKEGWSWRSLRKILPREPEQRHTQMVRREALAILAIFLNHVDAKNENQRLTCVEGSNPQTGECNGRLLAYIQDLGITFGGGMKLFQDGKIASFPKAEPKIWGKRKLWSNPETCKVNFGPSFSADLEGREVSEEGRQFLVKLLDGFTRGEAGRERLLNIFRAAHVEVRNETPEMWADAFMKRFEQLKYPMGKEHADFKCPLTLEQAFRKVNLEDSQQ